MKSLHRLRAFLPFVLFVSPAFAAEPAFDTWAETFAADWVRADPEGATARQYFSGAEQDALDRQLAPVTREFRAERVATAKKGLAALARFDRAHLDAAQKISADVMAWSLEDTVQAEAFADFDFVFNQFGGLHVGLVNFLSQTHPIRHRRDIENYLARLALVAARMDEGIAIAKDAATRGWIMQKFIYASTLGQFDRFLTGEPRQNVLVTSLDERVALLPEISRDERSRFVAAAEKIVADSVVPAYRRAQALLQAQQPLASDEAGISRLPGGDKAYAFFLRHMTTTTFTPGQVHELGLKEVARIEAEMDKILRQLGLTAGTLTERFSQLDASLQPPATPDPRPALIARFDEILRDAEKRAELIFDLRPTAPIVVRREPPFTEKTAAAHYTVPAKDGSRPGVFWAPLPGPWFKMSEMRTLVYHEGVPGHHFQIALQQEMPSLPRFRRDRVFGFISAHGEGWALYAEQLATENGWYEGDPQGRLGQLSAELFRARRLVVDTGLHVQHWTRQQAIDYGIIAQEVERYVVWPGQACAYKIGQLKILELRAKAKAALGDKFSIKEFHNIVLRTGSVPLDVLALAIDDYISAAR